MSFSTIPIKTTIPTPGTTPAAASAFIVSSIDEVNTLEITGDCSAGSGSLVLVRYFADLDEWRPWHEDRPLTVDSAVRDGLFSGVYPIPKGEEAFVLYDSTATITATVKARRTSSPDEATAAPASASLPAGAATAAKQDIGNTALASILGQLDAKTSTLATQTTAAAMLAQLDAKTSTLATGAKQDAAKTVLDSLATQTTAAAILAQIDNKTSTLATQATAAAIATSLTDGNQKTQVTGTVTVSGALTDTQLRATAVPVSGPLTDTQLRATAVPVSGTTTANQGTGAGAAVPWSVELSDGAAFYTGAKTGQFPTTLGQTTKAGSLSVALASDTTLPLPSGAATSALQGAGLPTALVGGKLDVNLGTSSITLPISAAANLPVAQAGVANFQYITAAGTYALKTSAGILRYIAVTAKFSAGSLSVFNANNAETSPIAGFDPNVNFFWPLNQTCSNGITVVAGAGFNGQVAVGWD